MEILNFRRLFLMLMIFSFTLSCSEEPIETVEELNLENSLEATSKATNRNSKIIKDQYIVLLSKKPAKADPRADAALEALTKEVGNNSSSRLKHVYRSTLTGFAAKMDLRQVEKLKHDKRVLAIYPDEVVELENSDPSDDPGTTNVQEFATWGLDRIDQRDKPLDRAYAYSSTGTGVNVYIMDSGIRYSHEEFGSRASLGVDLVKTSPDEYDEDDPDLELGNDCNGHGTHVAGTVGGKFYGVAKNANLISVRVFSCVGRTTWSRIVQAIEWVTDNAVHPAVVNMSIGGGAYEPIDAALESSVAAGIHYIVSAGNSNNDACNYSPARASGAITVGATYIDDAKANFSNFGYCLDVFAPGYEIFSASHKDDVSVVPKNGTSMAAPHVAGLAALFLQKNSAVTPAELQNKIILNSTPDVVQHVPEGPRRIIYSMWEPVSFEPPTPPALNLRVIGIDEKRADQFYLLWDPTEDPAVEIYHNGSLLDITNNDGEYGFKTKGKGINTFQVCELNYQNCSAEVSPDYSETDFVPNQPPTAAFSYEVNDMQVSFFDESTDSDGTIIRTRLNFGDGYYTTTGNFVYTYRQPGVYTVELWVTDDHEQTDVMRKDITVGNVTPSPEELVLTASGSKNKGEWQTTLSWTPEGRSAQVDVYRNGSLIGTVENNGSYIDNTGLKRGGSLEYKICETGSSTCSNTVILQF